MDYQQSSSLIEFTNRGRLDSVSPHVITGQFYRSHPFPMLTVATLRRVIELYGDEARALAVKLGLA